MTRKQLQTLISAGVFSAALLSGVAYAGNNTDAPTPAQTKDQKEIAPTPQGADVDKPLVLDSTTVKNDGKNTTSTKDAAQHGCAGAGGCAGK